MSASLSVARARWAARLAISLALLAWVVVRLERPSETWGQLRSAQPGFVASVLVLMTIEGFFGAYKLWLLMRCGLPKLPYAPVLRIGYVSSWLGLFLPGTVGIEAVRVYGLARSSANLDWSFASVLMDRIVGLVGLTLVVLAGTAWSPRPLPAIRAWALIILGLVILTWIVAGHEGLRRRVVGLLRSPGREWVSNPLERASECIDAFRSRPGLLLGAVGLAVGFNLLRVAIVACAARALGVSLATSTLVVVVPVVVFVLILPVSLGGWGLRETTFVALLAEFGVEAERAVALSLTVGVLGLVAALPGAWWLVGEP